MTGRVDEGFLKFLIRVGMRPMRGDIGMHWAADLGMGHALYILGRIEEEDFQYLFRKTREESAKAS